MLTDEENIMDLKSARKKYASHKWQAKNRKVEWLFTFDTWIKKWEESGKWEQRGHKKGQYCMSRPNDQGPYSPENVIIKTHSENVIEAHKVGSAKKPPSQKGKKWSDSRRKNHDISKINTPERAEKIRQSIILWHQKRKAELNGYYCS